MQFRPFGYSIDYDKAIAEDEAEIASLTSDLCVRISTELVTSAQVHCPEGTRAESWPLYHLVFASRDVASIHKAGALLGLTPADLRAWAYFCNEDRDFVEDLGKVERGDYHRGAELDKRFDRVHVLSEPQRKRALARAKASLSRHRRNKAKYGG